MRFFLKWFVAPTIFVIAVVAALTLRPSFFFYSPDTCLVEDRDDKAAIKRRAEARWDALINLDMAKVYSFATPAYRKTFDLKHLSNQYGAQVKRTGIDIQKIEIREGDPDTADVGLYLGFVTEVSGSEYHGKVYEKETWVRRNGCWWYLEKI